MRLHRTAVCTARRPRFLACDARSQPAKPSDSEGAAHVKPDASTAQNIGNGGSSAGTAPSGKRQVSAVDIVAAFRKMDPDAALSGPLGGVPSHTLVQFDEDGLAPVDRFVYVEERDCIGCTHCATTARATFCMEDEHGRARVFQQGGDSPRMIEEAVCS